MAVIGEGSHTLILEARLLTQTVPVPLGPGNWNHFQYRKTKEYGKNVQFYDGAFKQRAYSV